MVINGLVVTVGEGAAGEAAVGAIARAGPFELGERFGSHQVVLLQADDEQECRRWHEWVEAQPGVICVLVAFSAPDDCLCLGPLAGA